MVESSFKKVYSTVQEALHDVKDNSSMMFGGFGPTGLPENCIRALVTKGIKNITAISVDGGCAERNGDPQYGLSHLINNHQIKRLIASHVSSNPKLGEMYLKGDIELELIPMGTLAEKIRAGGGGIPAFYTKAGRNTLIEKGGFVIKYKKNSKEPEIVSEPKNTQIFEDGEKYILERSLKADFAFVKAYKADTAGNLYFNGISRNFNDDMATNAKITIAEVEEIVECGQIKPEDVHVQGVYINRIFKGEQLEDPFLYITKIIQNKQLSQIQQQQREDLAFNVTLMKIDSVLPNSIPNEEQRRYQVRRKIAKRAIKELKEGMTVNIGVGYPMAVPKYLHKWNPELFEKVQFQGENGILGIGDYPLENEADPELVNPGKETITINKGGSFFSMSKSFSMIRGQCFDIHFLGALQVSENGDLASWLTDRMIIGMGGAMDLATYKDKLVVLMEHCNKGIPKIVKQCIYPLTAEKCVDLIITEKAVFEFINNEIVLKEIAEETTLEELQACTGCNFKIPENWQNIKF